MFKHPRFQGLSILALRTGGVRTRRQRISNHWTGDGPDRTGRRPKLPKPPVQNLRIAQAVKKAAAANQAGSRKKPNIVFIMGDDIGMWNIGTTAA